MIDLGTLNSGFFQGWEYLDECSKQGHTLTEEKRGECLTRYECPICGYRYEVDSSG